nr:three-Cys-motif partner protein TcmP [uncultured Roseivirga sp.]
MYQHSEKKVELLKLYLDRYLSILNQSKHIKRVRFYDLFCGPGVYENGGEGSPIVALKAMSEILNSDGARNNLDFVFVFNDYDKTRLDQLSNNIDKLNFVGSEDSRIRLLNDDYQDAWNKCHAEVTKMPTNERAFVFIDPFGYKDISYSDIKSLLENKKTEVLLFLPTQFMFRFERKGTPTSLKRFIDEIVPEEQWPNSFSGLSFIENLKSAFRKNLENDKFVDTFIIARDRNQFFCLFFFTGHIYGFDRMLDAKWKIDEEEGRGWSYEEPMGLFSNLEKRPQIQKFEKELKAYLLNCNPTNGELYEFTLRNGFLPKHCNEVLRSLLKTTGLKVFDNKGNLIKKEAFYINYKNFKFTPEKVKFELK